MLKSPQLILLVGDVFITQAQRTQGLVGKNLEMYIEKVMYRSIYM